MHLKAYGAQVVPEHWGGEVPSSSNVIQPLITSIFFGGGTPSLADVRYPTTLRQNPNSGFSLVDTLLTHFLIA